MLSPDMLESRNYFHNQSCYHQVVVRHVDHKDAYGGVVYAAPVTYNARVEDVSKLIQDTTGQMRTAGGRVTFELPSPVIDVLDEITVPVPVSPSFPLGKKKIGKILDIKQDPTGAGIQPTVVYY